MENVVKPKKFTCCTFLVNPREAKVLMLFHKKFEKWLPPGGNLEKDEAPHQAAERELLEEVGLTAEFFPEAKEKAWKGVTIPPQPRLIALVETANSTLVDFVFFVKALATDFKDNEGHKIKWFSKEEITSLPEAEIYPNIRELALEALEKIK